VYDITKEQWYTTTELPFGLHHASATVYENEIYVVGGYAEG
jgi:N-acetylneuraminic acid mutarotase